MKTPSDPLPGSCGYYRGNGCAERAYPHYDRHGIYSGKSCDKHASTLPGQGAMWNYEAEEPINPEPSCSPEDILSALPGQGAMWNYDAEENNESMNDHIDVCDKCGEAMKDIDVGFCLSLQEMVHGDCGGTFRSQPAPPSWPRFGEDWR